MPHNCCRSSKEMSVVATGLKITPITCRSSSIRPTRIQHQQIFLRKSISATSRSKRQSTQRVQAVRSTPIPPFDHSPSQTKPTPFLQQFSTQMASSAAAPVSKGRHAFLHDFCMCIPYGFLVAAGGLLSAIWFGLPGLYVALAGVAEIILSAVSLKTWKKGGSSALFTVVEGVIASAVAYFAYEALRKGSAKIASGSLLALSAAAALFFFYNVAAGGNPPKSKESSAKAH